MKPVDTVVAAKLISVAIAGISYAGLADALQISYAEAHAAAKRLIKAGLFKETGRQVPYPKRQALLEFWVHGLKYVYPAELGAPVRGIPTSIGAAPLNQEFATPDGGVPVWPSPEGTGRGPALQPIHSSVLNAISDERVYELLSLIDALREGRVREQKLAADLLKVRLYSWC